MAIGKLGENIVIDFLKSRPSIINVEDFRDIRAIQKSDIDIGIELRCGKIHLAEIKTDTWLGITENFLFEVLRINHTSRPEDCGYLGWALRSPARFLIYCAPNTTPQKIFVSTFENIRRLIQSFTKKENARFNKVSTDSIKTTYNLLIPKYLCLPLFKVYDLVNTDLPY